MIPVSFPPQATDMAQRTFQIMSGQGQTSQPMLQQAPPPSNIVSYAHGPVPLGNNMMVSPPADGFQRQTQATFPAYATNRPSHPGGFVTSPGMFPNPPVMNRFETPPGFQNMQQVLYNQPPRSNPMPPQQDWNRPIMNRFKAPPGFQDMQQVLYNQPPHRNPRSQQEDWNRPPQNRFEPSRWNDGFEKGPDRGTSDLERLLGEDTRYRSPRRSVPYEEEVSPYEHSEAPRRRKGISPEEEAGPESLQDLLQQLQGDNRTEKTRRTSRLPQLSEDEKALLDAYRMVKKHYPELRITPKAIQELQTVADDPQQFQEALVRLGIDTQVGGNLFGLFKNLTTGRVGRVLKLEQRLNKAVATAPLFLKHTVQELSRQAHANREASPAVKKNSTHETEIPAEGYLP